MANRNVKTLSDGLPLLLSLVGNRQSMVEQIVFHVYRSVAGSSAERVWPARFDNGKLELSTTDKTWQQEVRRRTIHLRRKINTRLGKETVKEIFVSYRTHKPAQENKVEPEKTNKQADSREHAALTEAAKAIKHEPLRKAYVKFIDRVISARKNRNQA